MLRKSSAGSVNSSDLDNEHERVRLAATRSRRTVILDNVEEMRSDLFPGLSTLFNSRSNFALATTDQSVEDVRSTRYFVSRSMSFLQESELPSMVAMLGGILVCLACLVLMYLVITYYPPTCILSSRKVNPSSSSSQGVL